MARIAGINIPPQKHAEIGLTYDLRHRPYDGAEDLRRLVGIPLSTRRSRI